jgi:hypothetical protein
MLDRDGDTAAAAPLTAATLRLRMSDVYYRPDPNDNWTERATDAVLMVDPNLVPRFTPEIRERIWSKLHAVLRGRSRYDVFELIVEATVPPLPDIAADWRARAAQSPNAAEPTTRPARSAPAAATRSATNSCSAASPSARCTTPWSASSASPHRSGRSPSLRLPG